MPNWPPHVTGDEMVAAMDRVGVDGAIFISAFSLYQYDASYAVEVQRRHPGRFAIIKPVNPAVGEVIAEWRKQPGAVAVRIMMTAREAGLRPDDPGLDRIARAAANHDFPVNVLFWGKKLSFCLIVLARVAADTLSAEALVSMIECPGV